MAAEEVARELLDKLSQDDISLRTFVDKLKVETRSALARILASFSQVKETVVIVGERNGEGNNGQKKKNKKDKTTSDVKVEERNVNVDQKERPNQKQEEDFARWYQAFKVSAEKRLVDGYQQSVIAKDISLELFLNGRLLTMERLQEYINMAAEAISGSKNLTMRNYYVYGVYWQNVFERFQAEKAQQGNKSNVLTAHTTSWMTFVKTFPFPNGEVKSYETVNRCRRLASVTKLYPIIMLGSTSVHKFFKFLEPFMSLLSSDASEMQFWKQDPPARIQVTPEKFPLSTPKAEKDDRKREQLLAKMKEIGRED